MIPSIVFKFLDRFKLPLILACVSLAGMYLTYRHGISVERERSAEAAMELIMQRDKIDGKVNSYDDATLCRKLGLEWVSGRCQ